MAVLSKVVATTAAILAILLAVAGATPIPSPNSRVDEDETRLISDLLKKDFPRFGIQGTWVDGPKISYEYLNDFIYNSIVDGIHDSKFILNIFERCLDQNPSLPHDIRRMLCDAAYKQSNAVEHMDLKRRNYVTMIEAMAAPG
ncbi:hypothetical protein BDY21DRAFT_360869 [Lineolata rhizophorae]|uniref:Uncharacterized protein n=1 Tax=Lineolata rhizophorae TaxID=578093 RepID=A0A6A6PA85_9PEZI|nr:hypothetical protein BDY21DRAFT_360869 [Lineolata rhizophorae]